MRHQFCWYVFILEEVHNSLESFKFVTLLEKSFILDFSDMLYGGLNI